MTSCTHNKMKTSRQSSCQELDGNKMNTSAELSVTQVKKLQEIEQRIDMLTGCQGASAELSATQVKKLEELEERIDKLTDIYEEATNTLHASCSSEQQTQGLDNQTTPKTTQPVDEHKSDDDKHDEQPDKQSYKPRPFEDPRGYQGVGTHLQGSSYSCRWRGVSPVYSSGLRL